MTTISIHQTQLDEIEVLIEDHRRLIHADKEEIFRSTSSEGIVDGENQRDDPPGVNDNTHTKEIEEDMIDDEIIEFVKDKSMNEKTIATTTKKKKKSYLSLASKIGLKSLNFRHNERTESPPPPLSKATTFDTEQSSSSEEGDRDRKGPDTDHSIKLLQPTQEFSSLPVPVVTSIIEEQQKKYDEIHEAEIQREQEEIDQNLQLLYDDDDSGIEIEIESNEGNLELPQSETEKANFSSCFVSKSDKYGDGGGNNSVAVSPKNNAHAPAKNPPKKTRKSFAKQSIRFWKKKGKAPSSPRVEEKRVVSASEYDVGAAAQKEATIVAAPPQKPAVPQAEDGFPEDEELTSPSIDKTQEVSSLPLIDEESTPPESDNVVGDGTVGEEEITAENEVLVAEEIKVDNSSALVQKLGVAGSEVIADIKPLVEVEQEEIVVTAPPPSPVRKSTGADQLPFDLTQERLSMSKLLMLEDYPELRAIGPIDLDEVHDRVEQQVEYPQEMSMVQPNDPHSCSNVSKDTEGAPEILPLILMDDSVLNHDDEMDKVGLPETLPLIPPPPQSKKKYCTETTTSSRISSSKSFARFNLIVLVATMCVVVSIGIMSNWAMLNEFSLPKSARIVETLTDESCLPETTEVVDEEFSKENIETKKRKRRFWKGTKS